jgi:hypothetical protein
MSSPMAYLRSHTKPHLQYLWYVAHHKWYVFLECWHCGIRWRGIIHDWSKLTPAEWFPYVRHFHGPTPIQRDPVGYYKPTGISEEFDRAWLHHIHRNPHHWQHWLLVQDEDKDKILPMPRPCLLEMVADWRGAGKAQCTPDTLAWYRKHRTKMQLHPDSRAMVECLLQVPAEERML